MVLLVLLFSPLVATLLSMFVGKQRRILEIIAVLSATTEAIAGLFVIARVIAEKTYDINPYFSINALGGLVLGIVILVGFIATLHSVGYLRAEQAKGMIGFHRIRQYYLLMKLFMFCMFFAIVTTNPVLMWIAIEATTLSTVFLISLFNRDEDIEAAWKYLIINTVGLLLGLLGTLIFLSQISGSGFTTWNILTEKIISNSPMVSKFAFIFILIGYGTKMGLVPMHTWRPDTYNKAPSPIAALLSGALLNVAFLAILRFKLIIDNAVGSAFSQNLFVFFGIISIVIAAFIIYTQGNYKRMLAYHSTEHAGIMMLGIGLGGIGIFGALLHMIYHSFAKSLLFFVSSNIAVKYSSSMIKDVRGMIKVLPYSSVLYVIGFLTMVGIPPFGIFFSESYILLAGFSNSVVVAAIALFSLLLVFVGFFSHITEMLFGEAPKGIQKGENNAWTIVPIVCFAIILIVFSVYLPNPVQTLLKESYNLFISKN